jgi:protease stability complex PrcB-like protein
MTMTMTILTPCMTVLASALLMTASSAPLPPGSLRSIDKGLDSQIDDARQTTVRSAPEWEKLWRLHAGELPRPAVDFEQELVVAVFLGNRPTAGFSVEIVGAREDEGTLIVQYREKRPSAGAVVAQLLTSPFHIVALPRRAALKDVKFEKIN